MINQNNTGSLKILNLSKELLGILEREGKGEVNFAIRELTYMIDVLTNNLKKDNICDKKVLEEIKEIYKGLYPPHGGLTDFFIWRDDIEERRKENHCLDRISDELWNMLT
jgi:hypothetical protein